jgi:uncharacterized membrane protein YfcA
VLLAATVTVDALGHLGAAAAAFVAGGINAVAGGGTLVSFPALLALGVPSVSANATNTVALCPGYFGGAFAQRDDLEGRHGLLRSLLVVAALGGLMGSILLVLSSDELFSTIVPFLILGACFLLGFQGRIRKVLRIGERTGPRHRASPALIVATLGAAIYGGYFGAGLGIMLLAVLGVLLDDPLRVLNAMKSSLSLVINAAAAIFLAFSGKVVWSLVAVMAAAALGGGVVGGRVASRLDPRALRAIVVTFGIAVAGKMLLT